MNLKDRAFLIALGDRLRDRRNDLKLSQQQLADKCGLHRTFIGSVERGERNISVLNLSQIARALKAKLSELFNGLD